MFAIFIAIFLFVALHKVPILGELLLIFLIACIISFAVITLNEYNKIVSARELQNTEIRR